MREPAAAMLCLTLGILIIRAPYALRTRLSRPGWLASAFGLLAVMCLGFVIPVPHIDAVLGSAGYWNLLGAGSTTLSFHFMYQAILIHTSRTPPKFYLAGLFAGVAVYTLCFAFIGGKQERFVSVEQFISTLIDQPWTLSYLTVYLATVASVSLLSLYALLRTPPISKSFVVGFSLVALGNGIDICLLWAQHTQTGSPDTVSGLYTVYVVLFFTGAILLCARFLKDSLVSVVKYLKFVIHALRIRAILDRADIGAPSRSSVVLDPRHACYQTLIRVRDVVTLGGFILHDTESRVIQRVDDLLTDSPISTTH